jgi:hypothetical protein
VALAASIADPAFSMEEIFTVHKIKCRKKKERSEVRMIIHLM